jgi:Myosin-like coiled-coil protein
MNQVAEEINKKRTVRQEVTDENNQIRAKISARIDEYKKVEKVYQERVKQQSQKIKDTEVNMQAKLEMQLKSLLNEVVQEKKQYEKHEAISDDLKVQIKGYVEKFENLKNTISDSSKAVQSF